MHADLHTSMFSEKKNINSRNKRVIFLNLSVSYEHIPVNIHMNTYKKKSWEWPKNSLKTTPHIHPEGQVWSRGANATVFHTTETTRSQCWVHPDSGPSAEWHSRRGPEPGVGGLSKALGTEAFTSGRGVGARTCCQWPYNSGTARPSGIISFVNDHIVHLTCLWRTVPCVLTHV